MTTAQKKNKKVEDLEKKAMVAKLDKLFSIPPCKVQAENGSGMITIEHKIGKVGGYHTIQALMEKFGLEREHSEFVQDMLKQIKSAEERKNVTNAHYNQQKRRAREVVFEFKRHLELLYGNYSRPLTPAIAFVPVNEKFEEGLYIQGLVDSETLDLVVGDPEDIYRWTEKIFRKTKEMADLNHRAEMQAKALMRHHGINKDLKQRLHAITQGNVPEKLTFNG